MKTLLVPLFLLAGVGCTQPGANGANGQLGAPACDAAPGTSVFEGSEVYDALTVSGGNLYVEVPGAGVRRCPVTGCSEPDTVVDSTAFVSSALGPMGVTYTTQMAAPTGGVAGEVDAVDFDGSNERPVLTGLTFPAYVAIAGQRVFWIEDSFTLDDTPATVGCVGCGAEGTSVPWMSAAGGGTYGMTVDANNVYVLQDAPALFSVQLLACPLTAPCGASPRIVIDGLDRTITAQQIASDGTYVYAARAGHSDVVRVDAAGNVTEVVTSENVTSIAVDGGDLFYGTEQGTLARVSADGTGTVTTLACGADAISAIALDPGSAYFITGATGSTVERVARAR